MKKVLITGATGQTGSYMAEYLLENTNNTLILAARRTSQAILSNIQHLLDNPRVRLITLDLMDGQAIRDTIKKEAPDFFINLGAQTFVSDAWKHPIQHLQINSNSLIHILEAVREYVPTCRVYSAGSSEQFGNGDNPYSPRSIYGVSKCTAGLICKVYRESYGLYIVHGILYNHESPRRQDYFVTRKITKGVARIKNALGLNKQYEPIELGNLDAKRDWSHARDFVIGIWMMLNQEFPKQYILASGKTHSIREFVELAFKQVGIEGIWRNSTTTQKPEYENFQTIEGKVLVKINPKFYRPADVENLCGDSAPAREELGWRPKISFKELIKEMVLTDIKALE